ncbi:2'-5' RNA ligase [Candidatus Scalindua japonica]|uniref:RNA 2',3'-cyclic phosphodiesterase n=1 Tax=Candidatus Scalindua japonica TaxID=1284222 RepID=A0A286TZI4_9BACT|nr:RNA 2',3'-cyclic phosphodiesterase [Candidatus Scalindua japonica]GAX61268.1 2'-5' RNA ligase [Candidatus Scalindua japonica]
MTIRVFIAIEIDSDIKNKLSEYLSKLKRTGADVRWVAPENIHLTLKFIGNIDEEVLTNLNQIINDAASGVRPFSISIGNIGAFPGLKNPRVVYVYVQERGNDLRRIHEKLDKGVERLGIRKESGKYVGHITLGRVKSQRKISKLKNALCSGTDCFFGLEKVTSLSLIQSKLTPRGPIYTRLNNFILN